MHTVSFEVAKKLKEGGWNIHTQIGYRNDGKFKSNFIGSDFYAPTLGELIRELPDGYRILKHKKYQILTSSKTFGYHNMISEADTPEDAAALAWIELQKEK
jgi:hypothetical protein